MAKAERKCTCYYSRELRERLEFLIKRVEAVDETHHFPLRDEARTAAAVLKMWDDAEAEASRCQHCGQYGGH
jgi:hypothetical protein